MALVGHVGTLTHRGIVGWAWENDAPGQPVPLMVTIGTRVLGRCIADQYREDLAIEGIGAGWCGFELRLPAKLLSPLQGYEISVRREGDGLNLPGSPYVLERFRFALSRCGGVHTEVTG